MRIRAWGIRSSHGHRSGGGWPHGRKGSSGPLAEPSRNGNLPEPRFIRSRHESRAIGSNTPEIFIRSAMKDDDNKWVLLAVLPLAGLLAATLAVLWGSGLLRPTGNTSDGYRLSAVLALGGVMITASGSLIGLIRKRQSDRHLEVKRTESETRLEVARQEERQRLGLDAAMRAGSLPNSTVS